MYYISYFIYNEIRFHKRVRQEIANYLLANHIMYENVNIPTEKYIRLHKLDKDKW